MTSYRRQCAAGCTADSVGGENQVFLALQASLMLSNVTVSNTVQRRSFIEYSVADDEFRYTGIISVSGTQSSAAVLVRLSPPSPTH